MLHATTRTYALRASAALAFGATRETRDKGSHKNNVFAFDYHKQKILLPQKPPA